MDNLTLTRDELSRLLKYFGAVTLVIGIICFLILLSSTSLLTAAWRSLSPALLGTSTIFTVFVGWAWRLEFVARWMGRPDLRGVWLGYLSSDYGKTNSGAAKTLPIAFVVRQTYLTLSIQSFTESQAGESRVESLIRNRRTELTRLAYIFELKTLYPGQQTLTRGAGELELLSSDTLLSGSYWTDSPTHGTFRLRLQSREHRGIQTFQDATRRWPIGSAWNT
jgi:hypothetical protein